MLKLHSILIFAVIVVVSACTQPSEPTPSDSMSESSISENFDFQGHRGCRGLMPENSVEGFIYALDLGATTLEMDVVVSADGEVVLSHEPWFSAEICLDPDGRELDEATAMMEHRIYQMPYSEVKRYDCGSKSHPRFPQQERFNTCKPLLREVIAHSDAHAVKTGRPLPYYNIETKCTPAGDEVLHPAPSIFAEALAQVIEDKGTADRTIIQSFDVRTLQWFHANRPDYKLALLVENTDTPETNIEKLGFIPAIYSPEHILVDDALVSYCRGLGMKVIPWTVNDAETMRKLISMGVDGLISDYPDKFAAFRN